MFALTGCKLTRHQAAAGPDPPDCHRYDQAESAQGDPQGLQHQE